MATNVKLPGRTLRRMATLVALTVICVCGWVHPGYVRAQAAPGSPEPVKQMPADAKPHFDVVTIKPSQPDARGKLLTFRGSHFIGEDLDVYDLIQIAFGMDKEQVVNAPAWFGTDRFDIDGKPDVEGLPSLHQMGEMTQELLQDRFALKFHHEQRRISTYILSVSSKGPRMKETTITPSNLQGFGLRGPGDLVVRNMDMPEFALGMQTILQKPVVDHTGLTGKYDFTLKWTPDDSPDRSGSGDAAASGATDNPNAPPDLYTAIQEQLGLKISAGKAMDDVIVIDHAEKPSPN